MTNKNAVDYDNCAPVTKLDETMHSSGFTKTPSFHLDEPELKYAVPSIASFTQFINLMLAQGGTTILQGDSGHLDLAVKDYILLSIPLDTVLMDNHMAMVTAAYMTRGFQLRDRGAFDPEALKAGEGLEAIFPRSQGTVKSLQSLSDPMQGRYRDEVELPKGDPNRFYYDKSQGIEEFARNHAPALAQQYGLTIPVPNPAERLFALAPMMTRRGEFNLLVRSPGEWEAYVHYHCCVDDNVMLAPSIAGRIGRDHEIELEKKGIFIRNGTRQMADARLIATNRMLDEMILNGIEGSRRMTHAKMERTILRAADNAYDDLYGKQEGPMISPEIAERIPIGTREQRFGMIAMLEQQTTASSITAQAAKLAEHSKTLVQSGHLFNGGDIGHSIRITPYGLRRS